MPRRLGSPFYAESLRFWVLYHDTSDHPGQWVVRAHTIEAGRSVPAPDLSANGRTREECLAFLFARHPHVRQLFWLPRDPSDDPVIVGCWV